MNRFWSILFFSVPILAIVTFLMAQFGVWPLNGIWFSESYSNAGKTIDSIFDGIHLLSAAILLGTVLTIGWILWKFDHRRFEPDSKASYFTHNTKLELLWTVIPAAILIALAFVQMNAWAENKMNRPQIKVAGEMVTAPPTILVKAKQYGWEFHYPGADGVLETSDDLYIENLMVVPEKTDIVLQLESRDVIHSFFVADLRLKQDVVPGMVQFAWFNANRTGDLEILCTELCGWGHYKMNAKLQIVSATQYNKWLADLQGEYYR